MGILRNAHRLQDVHRNQHNADRKRTSQTYQEVHDHGRHRQNHDKQDSHHSYGNSQMKCTEDT
jgi:hypothetical protein